jgi:hypothetical protein
VGQEPRSPNPWKAFARRNAFPLGVVCYLLVVYVTSVVVEHYYPDSLEAQGWILTAALPGVIAFLVWWASRRAGR